MITDDFLHQKRVNISEHMVKMAPCDSVFAYIYSCQIEKDICDYLNVSVKLSCVYVCLSSGNLIFFCKRFLFLFLFLGYLYFGTLPFHMA
jgi:hypothetical protein